ncbi:hypothetical protein [Methylobacterium oryzihabitans]|uniref:Uncharacterized protein n=1 Tax=Methylobacterium oryzihabitans TaxID=2499852 RepID=A0A3S2V535_9HYPH|nr:hypothetical protein [Methylobacterium oryzihabitans]RVU14450.1 hypothetical protein EOE48_23020 [Methylobacterium oryzihabitans]
MLRPLALLLILAGSAAARDDARPALGDVTVAPSGAASLRSLRLTGVAPTDTTFQSTPNPDAILAAPGMGVAYCPGLACLVGSVDRNQRASLVVSGETKLDGEAEEQLLALSLTSRTGRLTDWRAGASYAAGANVYVRSGDNVFRVRDACTSGTKAPALPDQNDPKGAVVADGSCRLAWINRGAIAAKLAAYFETEVMPGSGNAWVQANNFIMRPGAPTNFNINTELDFSNKSGMDCPLGHNCTALRIGLGGENKATHAIEIASDGTERHKTIWGLRFSGRNLSSDALIALDSSSKYGLAANQLDLGGDTFSEALIFDRAAGKVSLQVAGHKSHAAIDTQAATIDPQGGAPTALVVAPGQQVCFAGFNVCQRYDSRTQRLVTIWNGQPVASLDSRGNAVFRGTVTQNGTP